MGCDKIIMSGYSNEQGSSDDDNKLPVIQTIWTGSVWNLTKSGQMHVAKSNISDHSKTGTYGN